ncbi:MAG: hypothetical protein J7577_13380 [Sphingobacteriaceae bacterium]|nr:hypothetical protein [Sphingobacteriaceae bacterium]
MTAADYLREANHRYPPGTKYISPYRSRYADKTKVVEVMGELKVFGSPGVITAEGSLRITDGYDGSVYCDGNWAKIEGNSPQTIQTGENYSLF